MRLAESWRKKWESKDMKMELNLTTILTIGGIIAVLGGFYYTTQHRLDHIEAELERIEKIAKRKKK